ncbi:copper resistance CopC family protein [Acrocarpospora catenulata]|uniref:copper resistance CopC family protein n=1 Tax=Acrocarpospora catenulata TaxID=2836182 RepID=UPI001BDB1D1D|nr:copper resistance protein CopC [Acrocarpospora catenulata]
MAIALGLVTLGVAAPPAAAHGQLALSDPAKDSTVDKPREQLLLYFTEQPASNAFFAVTSPSGRRVDRQWSHGEPKRLDEPVRELFLIDGKWEPRLYETGFPAQVPVAHWPEQGTYTVQYVSRASDGELVKGELKFNYTGAMTKPPSDWEPPSDAPDPALLVEPGQTSTDPYNAPVQGPQMPVPSSMFSPAPAAAAESGGGIVVWLIPAVLVVGVVGLLVGTARRPAKQPPATKKTPAKKSTSARKSPSGARK